MQKNKIDVVKAVCNSATKNLVALGLAAVTIGVGNAGTLSLVANAQQSGKPTITIDKKGVNVQDDSATSNYTYFGASLNGIERVGITNGDNFVAVKNDENSVEIYGHQDVGISGDRGDTYVGRRGIIYVYNPSRLQIREDNIPTILGNETSFSIGLTADGTLRNLMSAMDPEAVRRACEDFLANHPVTPGPEETNTTTTTQNQGLLGSAVGFVWGLFGGGKK